LTSVPVEVGAGGGKAGSGKPRGGGNAAGKPKTTAKPSTSVASKSGPIVQMSREWVRANIKKAVADDIADVILLRGQKIYSRHLVYTPMWLPAMAQHATAVATGKANQENTHRDHDVLPNLHYEEDEVKAAVNRKKSNLRVRFPSATTLNVET
jgi:hypothetical protein